MSHLFRNIPLLLVKVSTGLRWTRDISRLHFEHDTLLVTSLAFPVCVSHKQKGYVTMLYEPRMRNAHFRSTILPFQTRELFGYFEVPLMEKYFCNFLLVYKNNVIANSKMASYFESADSDSVLLPLGYSCKQNRSASAHKI
jgi:hypothetical protein